MRRIAFLAAVCCVCCAVASESSSSPSSTDICETRDGECPSCEGKDGRISGYTIFWVSSHPKMMLRTREAQEKIVKMAGDANEVMSINSLFQLHITANYLCCHTHEQQTAFKKMLEQLEWDSITINMNSFWCNYDMHTNTTDHSPFYLHSVVDDAGQAALMNLTQTIESAAISHNIPIYNPRAKAGPVFHMTIATVNGSYPIGPVVDKLRSYEFGAMRLCFLITDNPTGFAWARDCKLFLSEEERAQVERDYADAKLL